MRWSIWTSKGTEIARGCTSSDPPSTACGGSLQARLAVGISEVQCRLCKSEFAARVDSDPSYWCKAAKQERRKEKATAPRTGPPPPRSQMPFQVYMKTEVQNALIYLIDMVVGGCSRPNLTNHAPSVAGTSAEGGAPRAPPLQGIRAGRAQRTPASSTTGSGGSTCSCRGDRGDRRRRRYGRGRTAAGSARSCGHRPRSGCELCGGAPWGTSRGYSTYGSVPGMTLRDLGAPA